MSDENKVATLKKLTSQKTNAIYDYEFIKKLQVIPWRDWLEEKDTFRIRQEYLKTIHQWIHSTQLNQLNGLDRFQHKHLINGTTQSFDESYYRYSNRRLRLFRGEYAYHKRAHSNWIYIEDEPIDKNDFVIVSIPFCSTGDIHPLYESVLTTCNDLKVPVLVDCAYFGTCYGIKFDFLAPCIESVNFSLTKGIGLGDIRSGIRYSHFDDNFPIAQQNRYDHTVLAAAKIGLYMMKHFSPDFIPLKYKEAQISVCRDLNIQPTKCMHLGLGNPTDWADYLVDNLYYRIGLREAIRSRIKNLV